MMNYGVLKVVTDRENLITHNGEDFVMKGKHLREKIIKARKIPMKKRVKGKEVAKKAKEDLDQESEGWRPQASEVMLAKIKDNWEIDDTYKIMN